MIGDIPLPPPLERFVRDQLAAGRYQSEGDLVCAALALLAAAGAADSADPGGTAQGRRPTGLEPWGTCRGRAAGAGTEVPSATARRRPRGLLSDLRTDLSFDDVRAARRELWGGLRPGDV